MVKPLRCGEKKSTEINQQGCKEVHTQRFFLLEGAIPTISQGKTTKVDG